MLSPRKYVSVSFLSLYPVLAELPALSFSVVHMDNVYKAQEGVRSADELRVPMYAFDTDILEKQLAGTFSLPGNEPRRDIYSIEEPFFCADVLVSFAGKAHGYTNSFGV